MRVVFMTLLSLDGVTQGPGSSDEDTSDGFDRGGWFVPHLEETFVGMVQEWSRAADAYLLGRRTYTEFAGAWPNKLVCLLMTIAPTRDLARMSRP